MSTAKRKTPDRLLSIVKAAQSRATKCKGERRKFDLLSHLSELRRRFKTGLCEATGLPFDMKAVRVRRWNSPSIDRIDATRGYTLDNIRFVLWSVNCSLNNWGDRVFELIASAWLYRRATERCVDCD